MGRRRLDPRDLARLRRRRRRSSRSPTARRPRASATSSRRPRWRFTSGMVGAALAVGLAALFGSRGPVIGILIAAHRVRAAAPGRLGDARQDTADLGYRSASATWASGSHRRARHRHRRRPRRGSQPPRHRPRSGRETRASSSSARGPGIRSARVSGRAVVAALAVGPQRAGRARRRAPGGAGGHRSGRLQVGRYRGDAARRGGGAGAAVRRSRRSSSSRSSTAANVLTPVERPDLDPLHGLRCTIGSRRPGRDDHRRRRRRGRHGLHVRFQAERPEFGSADLVGLALICASADCAFSVGNRRASLDRLRERAELLDRERELLAERAVTNERVRIAQELHDVVAATSA